MPKDRASKKSQPSTRGIEVTLEEPMYPLIARARGTPASRNPRRDWRFWQPTSTAVKTTITPMFRRWMREAVPDTYRPDYGMMDLDREIEEISGNALLLSGPLNDFFLTQIGGEIAARLKRNSGTGLTTFEDKVPPTIFSQLMYLMKRYGAQVDLSGTKGAGMYGTVEVTITSLAVLNKVFSGTRSDGRNYLLKMHFDKERTPDMQVISHYRGKTQVVVTESRPFKLQYNSSRGKVAVSFFRQKYDRNGMAINTQLQAALSI
ncbi:uncharacterized protein [Branchiostoma lanceolatum]|uniref:uncharacterized protein n=1 Tax=Branchiostoma lanceolatum TaxID=7740 RepID=UPI003454409D